MSAGACARASSVPDGRWCVVGGTRAAPVRPPVAAHPSKVRAGATHESPVRPPVHEDGRSSSAVRPWPLRRAISRWPGKGLAGSLPSPAGRGAFSRSSVKCPWTAPIRFWWPASGSGTIGAMTRPGAPRPETAAIQSVKGPSPAPASVPASTIGASNPAHLARCHRAGRTDGDRASHNRTAESRGSGSRSGDSPQAARGFRGSAGRARTDGDLHRGGTPAG